MTDKMLPPGEETVFARFAATVAQRTGHIAYADKFSTIRYESLLKRVRNVEKRLRLLGAQEPGVIGILTIDRLAALNAILAVAASGHAYVLLDDGEPDKRLRQILAEAQPLAVLADAPRVRRMRGLAPGDCPVIDILHPMVGARPAPPDTLQPTPDSLLYISYTSGSTGAPKGVRQTHRNLLFFAQAYVDTLGITADDHLSWLFAPSASASNMDIYGAFLSGAKLCAYDIRGGSFTELANWLEGERISVLHTVPTVVRELARAIRPDRTFPSVRVIDLAGEMLFASDIERVRPHFPADCRIFNRLAATEASFISSFLVPAGPVSSDGPLPVGTTPADVRVAIMREDGTPAKPGDIGLIAIDSPHVAPGYHRRDDLTGAAFSELADPPGWRRYTSADLGRIDEAGDLHLLGRSGSRIKLRGQAVDLNEVEAAVFACPGVTGAAVIANGPPDGEPDELLAFVTLAPGIEAEAQAIRRQLAEHLPVAMLPSGFIFLDAFPETSTSKIDRKALAALDLATLRFRPGYVPPADEIEERVAAIFAEILETPSVGRLDDFFLLGGDSLALTNLQILATEEFGQQFSGIHEDATVMGIAARLRAPPVENDNSHPLILPIRTAGTVPPLFIVHGRRGLANVGGDFVSLLGDDQPAYAIQARGLDGRDEPNRSVDAMASDYVAAIRSVQPQGPYFLGGFCAGSYVALEMARLLLAAGEKLLPPLLIDPPLPNFTNALQQLDDENLAKIIKHRVSLGRWKIDLGNAAAVRSAVNVAKAFDQALIDFKLRRPPIASMVIVAQQRWVSIERVKMIFGQRSRVYLVSGIHNAMFSPSNTQFAAHMRTCIAEAAAAARWLAERPDPVS